ncbi:MAG: hypothetical protein VR73_16050 [Gammaproteobacteria bacterium BRH_c0]|nr:MAG: hypothetical protein VR73_16050 [Gammaproteobacteria bacterium BRH_c0]
MTRDQKEQFWLAHFVAWQRSGLSQADYCKQHGLTFSNFACWRTRNNKTPSRLMSITTLSAPRLDQVVLDLPCGIRMELGVEALPEELRTVLHTLREPS